MKIVLTDAQTVIDDLVNADPLRALGEVTEHGLLAYEEVAEQIADADVVVCNKTLMDAHTPTTSTSTTAAHTALRSVTQAPTPPTRWRSTPLR